MTKITEHAFRLLSVLYKHAQLAEPFASSFQLCLLCSRHGEISSSKVRRPRRPTSSSSESSSSSSTSESSSSASNFTYLNSSSSCSEVKKPTPRATIVFPSSLSRCHNSRVITATEYDPRDGTWVYSTTDKAVHNQNKAKAALLQNWNKFRHYCCKLPHCELCHEHQRSRRAGLM